MRLKERKGSESIDLARQELVKQVGNRQDHGVTKMAEQAGLVYKS
jgi:hypothetical protein